MMDMILVIFCFDFFGSVAFESLSQHLQSTDCRLISSNRMGGWGSNRMGGLVCVCVCVCVWEGGRGGI